MLWVLCFLVPHHKAVAEIRDLNRNRDIKVHMQWIKTHISYAYNEHANGAGQGGCDLSNNRYADSSLLSTDEEEALWSSAYRLEE